MNKPYKERYEAPEVKFLPLHHDLSLLLSFSIEGDFEEIEDGGEW